MEVVSVGGADGIDCIALCSGKIIAADPVLVLDMADGRLEAQYPIVHGLAKIGGLPHGRHRRSYGSGS